MEEKYIHALLNGTINVLKTMASTNPKPGKPYKKSDKKTLEMFQALLV